MGGNNTHCLSPTGYCYRSLRNSNTPNSITDYGCVMDRSGIWTMCDSTKEHTICCRTTQCNRDDILDQTPHEADQPLHYSIYISIATGILLIATFLGIWVLRKARSSGQLCKYWRRQSLSQNGNQSRLLHSNSETRNDGDVSDILLSPNTTVSVLASELTENSGSGSGAPTLVQRTISRQITLLGIKGKGR